MIFCATGVIVIEGTAFNITGVFLPFILLSGLCFTYFSLVNLLKEYHPDHYVKIQKPLRWFFIFEVLGQMSDASYVIVTLLDEFKVLNLDDFDRNIVHRIWLILWIIYPIFQAVGMIIIKDSVDPIQNISKLSLVIIVSINQTILPSFLPTMIKGDEWKKLTPEK